MGKSTLLCFVTVTFSLCVHKSCIACFTGFNENIEGVLGRNVTLSCNTSWQCNEIKWYRPASGHGVSISGEQVGYNSSYLHIPGIGFHDDGSYQCLCYVTGASVNEICSVTLKAICQATVLLSRGTILYNSSLPSTRFLNVTEGETISIACSKNAILGTHCDITLLPAFLETTNKFEVLQEHNACPIECRLRDADRNTCSVGFTLNVIRSETSTPHSTTPTVVSIVSFHPPVNKNVSTTTSTKTVPRVSTAGVTASDKPSVNESTSTIIPNWHYTTKPVVQQAEKDNAVPDKSASFPVTLLTGISVVVFVGILSIICFFIYFSRSKSTSRQKKTQIPGNESPGINIPISPTYATVNKSSPGGAEDSAERGIPCTDDAYAEVNSVVNKESSTQQVNAVKAETSITTDYYSVVNTLNTKLESTDDGNKSDSALYTEVNKGVKQAGEKVGTSSPGSSGCNPNVPDVQSYDVSEQPESSEYDAVGVVSASPALYAVVDKERKKE